MVRGGKRRGAGRPPKFDGGTVWINIAIPKETADGLIALYGKDLEQTALEILRERHPDLSWPVFLPS